MTDIIIVKAVFKFTNLDQIEKDIAAIIYRIGKYTQKKSLFRYPFYLLSVL